jgi:hypothetical protein
MEYHANKKKEEEETNKITKLQNYRKRSYTIKKINF